MSPRSVTKLGYAHVGAIQWDAVARAGASKRPATRSTRTAVLFLAWKERGAAAGRQSDKRSGRPQARAWGLRKKNAGTGGVFGVSGVAPDGRNGKAARPPPVEVAKWCA